jgi:diguanylate cyclase (GGDEF)-like protein/PAS domain S-box-containing protein
MIKSPASSKSGSIHSSEEIMAHPSRSRRPAGPAPALHLRFSIQSTGIASAGQAPPDRNRRTAVSTQELPGRKSIGRYTYRKCPELVELSGRNDFADPFIESGCWTILYLKRLTLIYGLLYPLVLLFGTVPKGLVGLFGFLLICGCIALWELRGGIAASVYASVFVLLVYFLRLDLDEGAIVTGILLYFALGAGGGWFISTLRNQQRRIEQEIRERKEYQEQLYAKDMLLSNAVKMAGLGPWTLHLPTQMLDLGDELLEMMGYRKGEVENRLPLIHFVYRYIVHEDGPGVLQKYLEASGKPDGPRAGRVECRLLHKDGSVRDVLIAYQRGTGNPDFLYGTSQDISEIRRTQSRLKTAINRLEDLRYALDESCLVSITDADGRITYINDKFCGITGYSREEWMGRSHRLINSGCHDPLFFADMWRTIRRGDIWRGEIVGRARNGTLFWTDTTIVPFKDDRNVPYQYISIRTDITDRKKAEEQIRYLAYHDPLTGVLNRRFFLERLEECLSARQTDRGALLLMDLDHFKAINDGFGHLFGDELLKGFTGMLQGFAGADGLLARLGGDEFLLYLPDRSEEEAVICCRKLLERCALPLHIQGRELAVSVSIGVSLFPEHGGHAEELLQCADIALYEAKAAGRNKYILYRPGPKTKKAAD